MDEGEASGELRRAGKVSRLATATTITIRAGTCFYKSSGTLTTLVVTGGGTMDLRQDNRARTFANVALYEGFSFQDPLATVTPTNGYDFVETGHLEGSFDGGKNLTWTPTAI